MARRRVSKEPVDLTTTVGSVTLANPVMTASGTAGHGDELGAYVDLSTLGAVVVKSLSPEPWAGNAAPRVHETPAGMINSVGLQGPGVRKWLEEELPAVIATGATVVASIWGTTIEDYAKAAELLRDAPIEVVAVEVNVSCPNLHDRNRMFAHAPETTAEAIQAASVCGRPMWAKLSPNVSDLASIAKAAHSAGADAVTLVNTVLGMAIDTETRTYRLGGGGGGLSGPAIHPVAVRAVHDVHAAFPEIPIIGVGGVARGVDAIELMMAGASAIQVGTASFADPRSVARVLKEIEEWCAERSVGSVRELIGVVHGR
ncbi:MAG: dihydroorotate dehydrogenase [Acidimicrobiia bacterium]|nr:dihydroorotate dehydrogenase [Acidimicrobiia bacterium]